MTLTTSDQKAILINTFVASAFTINVDFELATLVVDWLVDKVLINHVALDITKDGTRLAIETTLPLNYPKEPLAIKEILDTCFNLRRYFK